MAVAVRLGIVAILAGLVVLGFRTKAALDLEARFTTFRTQTRAEVLGERRGLDGVPSEEEVRADADALAASLGLTLTEVDVRIERGVTPMRYAGARVANELGEVPSAGDVDEEGNRRMEAARAVRTTRVTLTGHIHGEGFLVSSDADVNVVNEIGYAL